MTCFYPLLPSRVLSNCARKMEELHWIAIWVSFPRFRVSGIVFTSSKSTSFSRDRYLRTLLIEHMWLARMSELSRFVYVRSHVTLHVKSNAGTVNFVKNTPLRVVFSTLFSVFGYPDETLSLLDDGRPNVTSVNQSTFYLLKVICPILAIECKELTRIRPLSCGFDSSVGRALHRHRRGRGFESRSEPENFFQVSVLVVLLPHLH